MKVLTILNNLMKVIFQARKFWISSSLGQSKHLQKWNPSPAMFINKNNQTAISIIKHM